MGRWLTLAKVSAAYWEDDPLFWGFAVTMGKL